MAPDAPDPRLGFGTPQQQAQKRAALEAEAEAAAKKQLERDHRATERARAIKRIVQSDTWWAVEDIFAETFNELLESLLGNTDLGRDEILMRVGGLRMTRALYEDFDATLAKGNKAFERLTGGRLLHIAAAKAERPQPFSRQPA